VLVVVFLPCNSAVRKALSSEPFVPWGRYQALRGRVISDYSRLLLVVLGGCVCYCLTVCC